MNKYITVDLKTLSTPELKQLIKECEKTQEKASQLLIKKSAKFEDKFRAWVATGKKEKIQYMTWIDDGVKDFIKSNIYKDRYETIYLSAVLDKMDEMLAEKEMTKAEYTRLCKALMNDNFGSVVWDW